MKRIISILCVTVMVFTLSACGLDELKIGSDSSETKFNTGSVSGNKYTNDFIGISCELDENWVFMTNEQIEENNKVAMGMVGEDYKEAVEKATTFTDMMATHVNGTDTLGVAFEKLSGSNASLTEEKYADMSTSSLKGALESMGMTNVQASAGETTFAGSKHACIEITAEFNGIAVYEKLAIVKHQNYIICITACTWGTDSCDANLGMFKAI